MKNSLTLNRPEKIDLGLGVPIVNARNPFQSISSQCYHHPGIAFYFFYRVEGKALDAKEIVNNMKEFTLPSKLRSGDTIRIIAPSRSLAIISENNVRKALQTLENVFGFRITFGRHVNEMDLLSTSSISSRVRDLHDAFSDNSVQGILTVIGGFSSNSLLEHIDYDLIKRNPKVFCGFSDITVLGNAITAKTGLITYYGPHFSSFAMVQEIDYMCHYFKACLMTENPSIPLVLEPSKEWFDDPWFLDNHSSVFIKNTGPLCLQEGTATGCLIGGSLSCMRLLQGTNYFPHFQSIIENGVVLFIEDDDLVGSALDVIFDQQLTSFIQGIPQFDQIIKGILIGRCQKKSNMTIEKFKYIFDRKKECHNIPIILNANFGHCSPIFTLPIGGRLKMLASPSLCEIVLLDY